MKILLSSHFFHPSIGGIEEVSRVLAGEFVRLGHAVKLVTQTPAAGNTEFPLEIHRRPGARELIRLVRWCDVYCQNNVSLRTAWPLLFVRRPWVVTHATWTRRPDGQLAWQDHLKRFLFRYATNVAISQAVADALPVASVIVGNPYRTELFQVRPHVARNGELAFLGRLVSDKGVAVLLRALDMLREHNLSPTLTIVGEGPQAAELRQLAAKLDLTRQVSFVGSKIGDELVDLLNAHRILVVPSHWPEPFGLVALEGIACGCVVVGSAGGGLQGAIGPCGVTFPSGDHRALAETLRSLLVDPPCLETHRRVAAAHLVRFHAPAVAHKYLEIFQAVVWQRGVVVQPAFAS